MASFNLNIDTYNIPELEELLSLIKPYTTIDIEKNKDNLRKNLLKTDELGVEKKQSIIFFLDNISTKLINNKNEQDKVDDSNAGTWSAKANVVTEQGRNLLIQNPNEAQGKTAQFWAGREFDSSEQPPGWLNPINVKSIQKTVNIDTRFRPHYYQSMSTNFDVTLPEKFTKVVAMRLASIELPLTFHAISKNTGNSTFVITLSDADASVNDTPFLVTVPDGNYEDRFQDQSEAAFIENGINMALYNAINLKIGVVPATPTGQPGDYIAFTVDRVSGRSIFASKEGKSVTMTINFNVTIEGRIDLDTALQLKLGWSLGYRGGVYTGQSAISEGICFTTGPRYVYLAVKDYNNNVNNYFVSAFSNSVLQPDILARINLAAILQSEGVYKSGQDDGFSTQINRSRNYFGPVDIQRLKVSIYDEYGRILDLNNMDWSFALAFECLYD